MHKATRKVTRARQALIAPVARTETDTTALSRAAHLCLRWDRVFLTKRVSCAAGATLRFTLAGERRSEIYGTSPTETNLLKFLRAHSVS